MNDIQILLIIAAAAVVSAGYLALCERVRR
jgi:hypothetical protein